MMKCWDTFGFWIPAVFSHKLNSWVSRWATVPLFGSTEISVLFEQSVEDEQTRTLLKRYHVSYWMFNLNVLFALLGRNTTQNLGAYDRDYPQSLLLSPIVSLLTNKWPVAGSAVMASFWKVLAWTSSSSSLRSFSPASSSSSSSRLWERKETMTGEEREGDKYHFSSFVWSKCTHRE